MNPSQMIGRSSMSVEYRREGPDCVLACKRHQTCHPPRCPMNREAMRPVLLRLMQMHGSSGYSRGQRLAGFGFLQYIHEWPSDVVPASHHHLWHPRLVDCVWLEVGSGASPSYGRGRMDWWWIAHALEHPVLMSDRWKTFSGNHQVLPSWSVLPIQSMDIRGRDSCDNRQGA